MKKTLIAVAIALLSSTAVFAQAPEHRGPANHTEAVGGPAKWFEGIDLSDQQKAQLEELKTQFTHQTRENTSERRENARQKAVAKRREHLNKIKQILTPEQYITFLENTFVNTPAPQPRNRQGNADKRGRRAARANNGAVQTVNQAAELAQ